MRIFEFFNIVLYSNTQGSAGYVFIAIEAKFFRLDMKCHDVWQIGGSNASNALDQVYLSP